MVSDRTVSNKEAFLRGLDPDIARVVDSPEAAGVRGHQVALELVLAQPDASRLTREDLAELLLRVLLEPASPPEALIESVERMGLSELPLDARLRRASDALYALYHPDAHLRGPVLAMHPPSAARSDSGEH